MRKVSLYRPERTRETEPFADEGPISQDWTKTVVSEMLESFALVPFTRVLGKTQSECESIVRAAREELETEEARIYNTL